MWFIKTSRLASVGLIMFSIIITSCAVHDDISVDNAWIPEAPPTVSALAGYLDVTNGFSSEMILIGAKSPFFEQIVLHQTVVDDETDYARMIEQEQIVIAARSTQRLKPGSYHLMLLKPLQAIKADSLIPVILIFKNGYQKQVEFEIRPFRLQLGGD